MGEDGMEVDTGLEATDLSNILRIALNRLVQDGEGGQAVAVTGS